LKDRETTEALAASRLETLRKFVTTSLKCQIVRVVSDRGEHVPATRDLLLQELEQLSKQLKPQHHLFLYLDIAGMVGSDQSRVDLRDFRQALSKFKPNVYVWLVMDFHNSADYIRGTFPIHYAFDTTKKRLKVDYQPCDFRCEATVFCISRRDSKESSVSKCGLFTGLQSVMSDARNRLTIFESVKRLTANITSTEPVFSCNKPNNIKKSFIGFG
jgi:hypothetical protein